MIYDKLNFWEDYRHTVDTESVEYEEFSPRDIASLLMHTFLDYLIDHDKKKAKALVKHMRKEWGIPTHRKNWKKAGVLAIYLGAGLIQYDNKDRISLTPRAYEVMLGIYDPPELYTDYLTLVDVRSQARRS